MNFNNIRAKAIDAHLTCITSGTIEAKTSTYTQNSGLRDENLLCVINAFYFKHPVFGGILIDAGFSPDFYYKAPYGNLNIILKIFQSLNKVKYLQSRNTDTLYQLKEMDALPDHVFLTHRHPDHTSAIPGLPKHVSVSFGKRENTLYYTLLTANHLRGRKKKMLDFDQGFPFEGFDKAIDIFGDGSFLAISTRGHTKDHISYLVNGIKPYLIVGDAELTKESVCKGCYVNSDYGKKGEKDARESANKIRSFSGKHPEVEVLYSHDL